MDRRSAFSALVLGAAATVLLLGAGPTGAATCQAHDTLHITADSGARAEAVLKAIAWKPSAFTVTVVDSPGGDYARLVSFPSARPSGNPRRDVVYMQWYAARDPSGRIIPAPAVLLVHSLEPRMIVAKMIAREFAHAGLHAFIIEAPGYGRRIGDPQLPTGVEALEHGRQAVADVRRARDAILALPQVIGKQVALEGTSLGGFVAATAGSLDGAFDPILLLLAGANGYDVLLHGGKDAALLGRALREQGYDPDQLKALVDQVEPRFVAHRMNPRRTWLFSARDDQVIPRRDSDALAKAIGLLPEHRLWLSTNHYTTLFVLPGVIHQMVRIIKGQALHLDPAATQPDGG